MRVERRCEHCRGSGNCAQSVFMIAEDKFTNWEECTTCGKGVVKTRYTNNYTAPPTCKICYGKGYHIEDIDLPEDDPAVYEEYVYENEEHEDRIAELEQKVLDLTNHPRPRELGPASAEKDRIKQQIDMVKYEKLQILEAMRAINQETEREEV